VEIGENMGLDYRFKIGDVFSYGNGSLRILSLEGLNKKTHLLQYLAVINYLDNHRQEKTCKRIFDESTLSGLVMLPNIEHYHSYG
jgi:hypothetical protein